MSGRERNAVIGIAAAAMLLAGCFAPVLYGAYKVYDSGRHQVIVLTIMENPETVYRTSMAIAMDRGFQVASRDDKAMAYSGKGRSGHEVNVKVSPPPKGGSKLTVTAEKGKDPQAEREALVSSVLSVCSRLGTKCSEEK